MKYYYNDILVRTSTHEYHYAVIKEWTNTMTGEKEFGVLGCSKTYEGAVKMMRQTIQWTINDLEFLEALKDARDNNKVGFFCKGHQRKATYRKTSNYDGRFTDDLDEYIDSIKADIDEYNRTVRVVEIHEE